MDESSTRSHLITGAFFLLLLFRQHHPQGEQTHYRPVPEVAEHHGEQKRERDDGVGSCRDQKDAQWTQRELPGDALTERNVQMFSADAEWALTWAYLAIVPHPVRLHDALKARRELVGS